MTAIAALLLLPVVAFFAYDVAVFQPRRTEIQALLDGAPPEDRNPPESIRRYILAAHAGGAPPSTHVARQLLIHLDMSSNKGIGWHARLALWDRLVLLHLSQDNVLSLYSTLSYNGAGYGLSELSQRLFSKPLSALSESEAATVVAVLWAPSIFLRDERRLEERRDMLLARAQRGP
ncbi:MAG: transglycosylase domain-containing protein [Xanthomonadales bacterium]|nr:transglycosylase domain-containing protein [Xanthomonadales bacterium]